MQKSTSKSWRVAAVLGLSLAFVTSHAFADCDDDQEDMVGKTIAAAASAKIATVMPTQNKQMISLDSCDVGGGGLVAGFKFNVIGADGLYWVAGTAKVVGKAVTDLKITSLSPNLAAASAKAGVKLASN